MRLPGSGAVTGWAALRLHGGNFFDGLASNGQTPLPVPLAMPLEVDITSHPSIAKWRSLLVDHEITEVHGIPCTRPTRALFDQMVRAPHWRDAAVDACVATSAALLTIDELRNYVAHRRSIRGLEKCRMALPYVTDRVRSPPEARLMLCWCVDCELPFPRMNWPVLTEEGLPVGSPDLVCDELGVYGEFDGQGHASLDARSVDAARDTDFGSLGLTGFRVVGGELHRGPLVARRILATVSRARHSHPPRRWRLSRNPPPLVRTQPAPPY